MSPRSVLSVCALLALLLPLQVVSQEGFDLSDALGDVVTPKPTPKPAAPAAPAGGAGGTGGAGEGLSLEDLLDDIPTTSKAPPKVVPKAPASPKAPVTPKTVPAPEDFNLEDALDPNNDIAGKDKDKKRVQGGGFTDDDLAGVGNDDTYKPDKGKGTRPGDQDQIDQYDDNTETTAEVGTIAGIVSAVAMALVGAISSYISYQKKKFCFSIQQSLNAEMVKSENPDAVVATEPQVQQTLLESANAEPPAEENAE